MRNRPIYDGDPLHLARWQMVAKFLRNFRVWM